MIAKVARVIVSALFVYWFAGLLLGWDFTPDEVDLSADVSADTVTALLDAPATRAQIRGALDQIAGTPSAPGFLRLQQWIDEGWDPNRPDQPWPEGDGGLYAELGLEAHAGVYGAESAGSGELEAEQFRAIVEGNRARHADAIAAIRAAASGTEGAEWSDVRFPEWTPVLAERFAEFLELEQSGDYGDLVVVDFASDMVAMVETWYPRLSESAELYRRQCLHCHGVEGGGDGPTAEFLRPRPRDYRRGIFKFTSVANKARPRREDLYRILHDGIYGTAMPSFARFTAGELHGLADYVRLLSIRGEVEGLLALAATDNEPDYSLPAEALLENYVFVWERWLAAEESFIAWSGVVPEATPELIEQGRRFYRESTEAGDYRFDCITCHGAEGRGDGGSSFEDVHLEPGRGDNLDLDRYPIEVDVSGADVGLVVVNGHPVEFDAPGAGSVAIDLDPGEQADKDDYFPIEVDMGGDRIGLRDLVLSKRGEAWRISSVQVKRAKLDDWGNPILARDFTRGVFRAGRRPIDVYRRAYAGINGTPMPDHSGYDPAALWALVHYVRSLATADATASAAHVAPAAGSGANR